MATKLDKDIIRESNVIIKERNVIVTVTADQKIKLKLKGMKSGELEIPIQELYNNLSGNEAIPIKDSSTGSLTIVRDQKMSSNDKNMFSLTDFRSAYIISTKFDLVTKAELESITTRLLKK